MNGIKNFLLIPNTEKEFPRELIVALVNKLLSSGAEVSIFPDGREKFSYLPESVKTIEMNDSLLFCDAAVVLGGDGSIIGASERLRGHDVPIIGVNFGHVGFLAEIEIEELDLFDDLIFGRYTVDERLMLVASVISENGEKRAHFTVLNDIVLTNGPVSRLISFDISCDGVKIQTCRADGVIASTPTGSTAYSLSAGGPILDPSLRGICLTPICPHTLSSRPVIYRDDSVITISNIKSNSASVYLNADGRDVILLTDSDTIEIKASEYKTKLIRVKERGFLGVLNSKLAGN